MPEERDNGSILQALAYRLDVSLSTYEADKGIANIKYLSRSILRWLKNTDIP
jgi:hypothetical protein